MQIEGKDTIRQTEVTDALIRALSLAVKEGPLHDRARDAIVVELDRAITTLSLKTFQTQSDSMFVEALENLVLDLRIRGASASEPADVHTPA